MNDVFGRSMFAPKTAAREKLRNMGGIVASSAPLMQAARGYADGETVNAGPEFVITVPGYRGGAMLRVNESTLMMMNDLIPELMSQEGTEVFSADMFAGDAVSKIRPGDAIINADLNPRQQQPNPRPDLVSVSEIPSAAGQLTGEYMAGMDQQMRDLLAAQSAPVLRSDTELGSGYRGPNPAQEQDALAALIAQQGEESRQRVEGYDRQFINDANRGIPMPVQPTVVGSGEPSAQAQMAGLASDLSSPGDFREPSTMTAMERLMAEQNAVPPMLRDVSLDDTQAQPEATQPEMLMPPLSQQLQPDASFDLGSFLEAMYPNGDPTVLPDVQGPPTAPRAPISFNDAFGLTDIMDESLPQMQAVSPEKPVSRKQTVLERKGLESMFGGPDLSNYTGERTTFSDAMTNPADPTFETLDDNKAAIDELLKNKDLSDNERKALESKRAFLEGLSLTNTFVKGFVEDTISLDENTKTALNDTLNRTNDALTDVAALGVRATAPYVSVVSPKLGAKLFNAGDYLAAFGQDPNASDFNFGSEDLLMGQDVIKPTTAVVKTEVVDPKVKTEVVAPKVTPEVVAPEVVTTKVTPEVVTTKAELGNDVTPEKLTTTTEKILTALSNGDDDAAAEGMLADFGVSDAGSLSMEEQTNKMVEVFKKILGEDDNAKAKRNALLMANIGFSIAAQGGPNALQNIATGFQQGSAQAMENMATDQARQDKIKMLGIETAADQMAANQKYKRDMAIANIKGTADKTVSIPTNPITARLTAMASARENNMSDEDTMQAGFAVLEGYSEAQMAEGAPNLMPVWRAFQAPVITTQEEVDKLQDGEYFRTTNAEGRIIVRQK